MISVERLDTQGTYQLVIVGNRVLVDRGVRLADMIDILAQARISEKEQIPVDKSRDLRPLFVR